MKTNRLKTTLYFDPDLYYEIKKAALEERKTITSFIEKALKKELAKKIARKKKTKSRLFPGFRLGKIKGNLSREEIYDFI